VISWLGTGLLLAILLAAAVFDARSRTVPAWLTFGAVGLSLAFAGLGGGPAVLQALLGIGVGGLVLLPVVVPGWFGLADAVLLAAVGGWEGWRFALWTVWWAALAGACLALVAWRRQRRVVAYVPALAIGAALSVLSGTLT
jgi:prepilin signal peptidase PulO-like enzyme (type II secretory pathway)